MQRSWCRRCWGSGLVHWWKWEKNGHHLKGVGFDWCPPLFFHPKRNAWKSGNLRCNLFSLMGLYVLGFTVNFWGTFAGAPPAPFRSDWSLSVPNSTNNCTIRQMATHGSHMDGRSTTLVHLVLICSHLQQITHHLLSKRSNDVGSPPPTNLDFCEQISVNNLNFLHVYPLNIYASSKSRGVHVLPQCAEVLHPDHPTHFGHHPIPEGSEPLPPDQKDKMEIRKGSDDH